jgi:phytoene dehydrogenase-like protein
MTTRRSLLQRVAQGLGAIVATPLVAAAAPALVGLSRKGHVIGGGFVDDDAAAGHAVRDGSTALRSNRPQRAVRVAIVGGGVGGLSTGWRLDALGLTDWTLLELGAQLGGNARSAQYRGLDGLRAPWGAHYLPVPPEEAVHVRALCRELGLLSPTGEWDERMLCHSPQERIWQHGRWREGIDPRDAATPAERAQFARFEERVNEWRASGMFRVPSAEGHRARTDALRRGGAAARVAREVEALDTLTADAWLRANALDAPSLRWWVEYGTRDDYGASLQQASAWAAAHYFAARAEDEQGPLTWPEGNDYLVRELSRRLARRSDARGENRLRTGAPVVQLERRGTKWVLDTPTERIVAEAVVWAAPLFVLPRVCRDVVLPVTLEYAPWVVANLVLDAPPQERGAPLAWDNVIYGSSALGYVNAQHQLLSQPNSTQLWTWYHALTDRSARDARMVMQQQPWSRWRDTIVHDLQRAHPDIAQRLVRVDVKRWGHAMARPVPGTLSRVEQLRQWTPAPRLFMAHADLSNLSLFEEAQWHGVQAGDRVVAALR